MGAEPGNHVISYRNKDQRAPRWATVEEKKMGKKRVRSRLIGYRGFRKAQDKETIFDRYGNKLWHPALVSGKVEERYDDMRIKLMPGMFKTIADARSCGATKCVPVFERQH